MLKKHALQRNLPGLIRMLKQHALQHCHPDLIGMLKQHVLQHCLPGLIRMLKQHVLQIVYRVCFIDINRFQKSNFLCFSEHPQATIV
jgi:hypothetical protein